MALCRQMAARHSMCAVQACSVLVVPTPSWHGTVSAAERGQLRSVVVAWHLPTSALLRHALLQHLLLFLPAVWCFAAVVLRFTAAVGWLLSLNMAAVDVRDRHEVLP
jgi:hypothetical protein